MAHKHSIYDTDPHFSIDAATRAITNLSETKTKIIQYDHNSERFTFEIPRYIDGHDMSLSDKVEIHFINISANKNQQNADVYLCDDVQISPDDDNVVIFSWLISHAATQFNGTLNFTVRFTCLTGELIDYAWNTAIYQDIQVASGYNYGDTIIEDYSDVLAAWKRDIDGALIKSITQAVTSTESGGVNVLAITQGDGTVSTFEVRNGAKGDAGSIKFIPVAELPTENIDEAAIYLLPVENADEQNLFTEYVYINGKWETIGAITVQVDHSEYVKFTDYAHYANAGVVWSDGDEAYRGGVFFKNGIPMVLGSEKAGRLSDLFFNKPKTYSVPILSNDLYRWMKVGLTQNDQTLTDDSTDESGNPVKGEKSKACDWLGALQKKTTGGLCYSFYGINYSGEEQQIFQGFPGATTHNWVAMYDQYKCLEGQTPIKSTHVANKDYVDNLPDKLTLSDEQKVKWVDWLGAAPAGYGLGRDNATIVADANNAVQVGFYRFAAEDAVNYPSAFYAFRYGTFIVNRTNDTVQQIAFYENLLAVRYGYANSNTWSEWEYINPPMELGVEYRTTERLQGLPVYTCHMDCGNLPSNSDKAIDISHLGAVAIIGLTAYTSYGATMPCRGVTDFYATTTSINVFTNENVDANQTFLVTVKYLKR